MFIEGSILFSHFIFTFVDKVPISNVVGVKREERGGEGRGGEGRGGERER